MDPIEAGLLFMLEALGADAGAVLLAAGDALSVRAERRWGEPLLRVSRELWDRAQGGARGPMLSPPVLAFPAMSGDRLVGLACVAVPAEGRTATVQDVTWLAQYLVQVAVSASVGARPARLAHIHESADPAAALMRMYERCDWNVAAMARRLSCTRKAIYAAARRYSVRIAARRSTSSTRPVVSAVVRPGSKSC